MKISFACHNPARLAYIKGEADLEYRKGKFYLLQTVDIPRADAAEVEECIGCDFGQRDICTLSMIGNLLMGFD